MDFLRRIPLAWCNLTHDRRRCLVCVAGVTFAVFLLFVELGFWNALLDSSSLVIDHLNGELVVVSKARESLAQRVTFPRQRLEQARMVEGVKDAYPLYLETLSAMWKNTENEDTLTPISYPIRVIAFDPTQPVFQIDGLSQYQTELVQPSNVLFDKRSKADYGRRGPGVDRELSGHQVHVVGTFTLGTDFTTDGNVIMSEVNYARLFPLPENPATTLSHVDLGVIQLRPGVAVREIQAALRQELPEDVEIYTRAEYARKEQRFWQRATPIGFIFQLGLVMGFIVGAVICYQIVSSDVSDQLAEFATLKAIGYHGWYLNLVVVQEALWLALLGFVPGLCFSLLFYWGLAEWNGLPMRLTFARAGFILALTIGMCVVSGMFAVRKVQTADPAEVF